MAILIKAKNVAKTAAKVAQSSAKVAQSSAKVAQSSAKVAKSSAKVAKSSAKAAREPSAKRFFLSREACALHAMRGIDTVPAYWTVQSCHSASEIGEAIVAEADKVATVKLSPAKGLYLVGTGPKGSRCVPITHANGQIYERKRDGITVVRGNAATSRSYVGTVEACERWLKTHTKKGLTDFWRSSDGSKETARKAGFACF